MTKATLDSVLPRTLVSLALTAGTFLSFLTSCSSQATQAPQQSTDQYQGEIINAQQSRLRKVEITVTAPVYKCLRDDTTGLPHQRFLLGLSNGTTVLVAHDTAMAPPVPLHPGDVVTIRGEYIWNERGGVLHWTHHTDTPRHEGGWIDFNGMRYQ